MQLFTVHMTRPRKETRSHRRLPKAWLAMKLTTFFLCVSFLQVTAKGLAQKVNLNVKDAPLEQVFQSIQRQSEYDFIYKPATLSLAKPVTLHVKQATLQEALDDCFKGQPHLTYKMVDKVIIVKQKTETGRSSQSSTPEIDQGPIHGRVTDSSGKAIEGVSVVIKGTAEGTITNQNGEYRIMAKSGAVLQFSYVGYISKEVTVGEVSEINMQLMAEVSSLDDVVMVGYGTQKKINLTGAVAQVSGKVLENRPIANIAQGLQGAVPNLNITTNTGGGAPNATKSINIRGYTGLGTSGSPLILVDGVPADINSVNPSDVESISVLKDASVSAIYGSRAPYGVILVTTKKGKKNQPLHITANTNFSLSQPVNVPQMVNSLQFANLYNEAAANAQQSPIFDSATIDRIKQYMNDPLHTPTTIADPNNPTNWNNWDKANSNNDWFDIYLKDWSSNQNHNVSLSGGTDRLTYFMGLGYTKRNGIYNFANDSYGRYNLRANVDAKVTDWFTVGLKTSFALENSSQPHAGSDIGSNWFHQIPRRWPTTPLFAPDGTYSDASYVEEFTNGGRDTYQTHDSWITGDFTITPLKGWDIKGSYSYNYYSNEALTTVYPTQYSLTDGSLVTSAIVPSVRKQNDLMHYHTYNLYSSYGKQLGGHNFKVVAGYQQEYKNYGALFGSNQYPYNYDIPSLSLTYGDQINAGDLGSYNWSTQGWFGRFTYNYNEKYLFEFSGRYDGSSLFPKDTRYHFFPSFSAGYNISKERFWDGLKDVVSQFKIRASYGKLGDISTLLADANYYPYQPVLTTNPPTGTNWIFDEGRGPTVNAPTDLVSPTLTWAKPSMLDFGADISLLNNAIDITFDWYNRKTLDLFGPPQVYPGILGIAPPLENNASVETKGFELSIGWNHTFGDLTLNAKANLSNYKGKVLDYPNPTGDLSTWYKGQSMGAIWGYQTVGYFKSAEDVASSPDQSKLSANWYPGDIKYADLNQDGRIDWGNNTLSDPGDQKIIGNSTPQYSYGFTLSLKWKNFDFYTLMQGVGKRDYWTTSNYFWGISGDMWQSYVLTSNLDRWTPSTPNGYFPRYYLSGEMDKNMQPQTHYLLNAAYFRMKSLQIGYTFPENATSKIHIPRLRIYFSTENLFTIAPGLKHFQVDPELLTSDLKIYPIQRMFSIGANITLQ